MRKYHFADFSEPGKELHFASYRISESSRNGASGAIYHCHDFFEYFYVSSGNGLHHINGEQVSMRAGDLWLIRPEDAHSLHPGKPARTMKLTNVAFPFEWGRTFLHLVGGKQLEAAVLSRREAPHVLLTSFEQDGLWRRLQTLPLLSGMRQQIASAEAFAYILRNLFEDGSKATHAGSVPHWLMDWRATVSQPEHCILDIQHAHALAGCGREHLARICRQHFNCTPTEVLLGARIRYLQTLLLERPEQLVFLAEEVGFHNLGYCHRVFKRVVGCTPEQWRRKHAVYFQG